MRSIADIDFLFSVARKVGLPIVEDTPPQHVCSDEDFKKNEYTWFDGRILWIQDTRYGMLEHEIAHYLHAKRTKDNWKVNYGLAEYTKPEQDAIESIVGVAQNALNLAAQVAGESIMRMARRETSRGGFQPSG